MRIAKVRTGEEIRTAVVSPEGDSVHLLNPEISVLEALTSEAPDQLTTGAPQQSIDDVQLLAPLDPPFDPRLLGL